MTPWHIEMKSRKSVTLALLLATTPCGPGAAWGSYVLTRHDHVATFTQATSQFTYYLANNNYSIAGTGNADGSLIERLDYSSSGDFAGGGPGASTFHHDADHDLDLDLRDFANFQNCFRQTGGPCLAVHDFDTSDTSDGDIDLADYARWSKCSRGPFVTPDQACGISTNTAALPVSGMFTLHGRPVDILSNGDTLLDFRARVYLPQLGRWLQRDPLPYNDGFNLYESFRNNAMSNLDPTGEGIITWFLIGDYSLSDAKFLRDNGFRTVTTPIYGFFEGGAQTVAGGAKEFGLIFVGESAAQQRLVNLVEAEFEVGGATADETGGVILRATGQGIVDFFGASNVATALTGEQIVFVQEGQVFILEASAFERLQAGVGGVGQFAGTVSGLGGAGLSRLARPATPGITTAATNAVRVRVLGNIAESQAARAASKFEVLAAHEAALPALTARGGPLPVRIGQAGVIESVLAFERAGFAVVGREITMETALARTRLDLLVEAPQTGGIVPGATAQVGALERFFVEVKTGTGRLSPNQRLAFPEIVKAGGIPRGLNASEAELRVGTQTGRIKVIIIRR